MKIHVFLSLNFQRCYVTYSVLGIDTQTGQRVKIHKSLRLQGFHIIGLQGTGKTVLINHLANQDGIQDIGFCLLDLHGDLTHDVLSGLPPDREKDVIYLDLTDYRHPFGLNLFTCADPSNPEIVSAAASRVMHIFKRLWGKGGVVVEDAWGVTLEELLWNATLTFLEASKDTVYTMAEIPLLLTDRAFRNRVVNHLTNRHVKDYWLRKYNLLSEKDQREETRSTLNRINAFLTQPMVECIVGQAQTTIDYRAVMDERKILLVKLSKRHEAVTALIGSMVIAELLNAAYSRIDLPMNKRKQFHIYVDEAQNYQTEDFATLLEEGRKFGIGTTIAHQNLGQIEFSLRERIRSVPSRAVFKVNSNDAAALAGEFNFTPAPERLQEIEKEQLIGQRPVRTYKRDVIGHLLRQGHEDERVTAFVRNYLQELHLASLKRIEQERKELWHPYGGTEHWTEYIYPRNHLGIEYNPEMIPRVLADLNTWLFAGMRDQDALWQPLPSFTLWWLAHFFGFETIYDVFSEPLKSTYVREQWQTFQTEDFLTEEARRSSLVRNELAKIALFAIEEAFIDFLSFLFQTHSRASLRSTWQHKGIDLTTISFSQIQDRSLGSLTQITNTLRKIADMQSDLDLAGYKKHFLEELAKPELAIDVFLPLLYCSYRGVGSYEEWRTIHDITVNVTYGSRPIFSFASGLDSTPAHDIKMALTYTYHLKIVKSNLYLSIIEEIQNYLKPFLAYLRFYAHLHLAQLALSQRPILTMDSGEYEQDKRTSTHYIMHAQRPYADMLNEVASQLTNLPLYTARVRMTTEAGQVEHTIRTLEAERGIGRTALQERIARIQEHNRTPDERGISYCRLRQEVEEEIRKRQEQYREPPEEPPITRRPPR